MAKCDYCGSTILFGGKRDANGRFCNQKCQQGGALLALARQVPDAEVQQRMWSIHQGVCPKCKGTGPVDVHLSYKVWSALVITRWSSQAQVSCRSCAMKSQAAAAAFSLALGWWGFPWGLVITPIQIGRNIHGMMRSESTTPSPQLEKTVRMSMVAKAAPAMAAK